MKIIGQKIAQIFQKLFLTMGGQTAPKSVKIKSGLMTYREFTETYYPFAKQIENDSGCPALFILAQASIESGWNKYRIGNNALFGVTARVNEKNKVARWTIEYFSIPNKTNPEFIDVKKPEKIGENSYKYRVKRWFRDYNSPAECFADHLAVLRKPWFSEAWKYTDNPYRFAECIARGNGKLKYATAPNYESILKQRMRLIVPYIKALE